MTAPILIIGGTGGIGCAIARRLRADDPRRYEQLGRAFGDLA